MAVVEISRIQVRRGQELQTGIPRLEPGEFGWAEDTEHLYIGKRIVEGANSDDNSRILTQSDYDNLFAIASGAGTTAVASTSTYRYRDNIPYSTLHSTTTTIAKKLDINVSLVDFGVVTSSTAADIYPQLTTAIADLYANADLTADARRRLLVPAGEYYVSGTIDLPPNTSLVGEGSGLTKLILFNDATMFRTVDASGFTWDQGMQVGGLESKNISIEGMTLAYVNGSNFNSPLISLDNTTNALLRDVNFSTDNLLVNTTYGTGLRLRGGPALGGVEQAKNITIENCAFKDIGLAVFGTGTVVNIKIENSVFYNLNQGINFAANNVALAPSGSVISKNKFENIQLQAIYVGTSTNRANLISENNVFQQVGNGTALNDNTSTVCYSVLSFYGEGCRSINDAFSRKDFAIASTTSTFYYNSLMEGNGVIVNEGSYNAVLQTVNSNGYIGLLDKFYGTTQSQKLKLDYSLSTKNNLYTRSGTLTVTVPETALIANTSLSDNYDYSYDDSPAAWSGLTYVDGATGEPGHPVFNLVSNFSTKNYVQLYCQIFGVTGTTPGDGDTYILNYTVSSVS